MGKNIHKNTGLNWPGAELAALKTFGPRESYFVLFNSKTVSVSRYTLV